MKNVNILFVIFIGLCLSLSYGCKKKTTTTNYPGLVPTVTTFDATGITSTSATCNGDVIGDSAGEIYIIESGIDISKQRTPWPNGYRYPCPGNDYGAGSITIVVTRLTPNTTYYFAAYSHYSNSQGGGTVYGTVKSFTTLDGKEMKKND